MAKARVLVADDNEAIRDVLASLLAENFEVIRAVSEWGSGTGSGNATSPGCSHPRHFHASFEWNRGCAADKRRKSQGRCRLLNLLFRCRHL